MSERRRSKTKQERKKGNLCQCYKNFFGGNLDFPEAHLQYNKNVAFLRKANWFNEHYKVLFIDQMA